MHFLKSIKHQVKNAVYLPYHFFKIAEATQDFGFAFQSSVGRLRVAASDEAHLKECMLWLARAQEACQNKGVCIKYGIYEGWDSDPYPETTGYILETFFDYAKMTGDRSYVDRAIRAGDWEIEIQHPSGGVLSSVRDVNTLRVFNTGQVIHGWCRLFEETSDQKYLDAAIRACNYLIEQQETDGSWIKDTYDHGPRTYQARTSWAMVRVAHLSKNSRFSTAAYLNHEWSLKQQQPNGWFQNCGLANGEPITHVIAYTLRGLLETHIMMKAGDAPALDDRYLDSVVKACDAFCDAVETRPALGIKGLAHCSYDKNWRSVESHSCLTGNVQMAGILYKLAKITNHSRYQKVADSLVDTTKRTQNLDSKIDGVRGGLAGSFPFSRGYAANYYLNWATKFMADALIMRMQDRKSH